MLKSVTMVSLLGTLAGCSLYFGEGGGGGSDGSNGGGAGETDGTKRIFVTSSVYQGGLLGGIAGADAKCDASAANAALDGEFKAWISDAHSSPQSRMTHSTGEYTLVDGTMVAQNWTDLLHADIMSPIDLDESGQPHDVDPTCMLVIAAWTATSFDGLYYKDPAWDTTCGDWNDLNGSGMLGDTHVTDQDWTQGWCTVPCTSKAALYCVEQ